MTIGPIVPFGETGKVLQSFTVRARRELIGEL
jgi:hypothetical protein